MHAMVLPALLLLLGVRCAAGYRNKGVTREDLATESLAQRRQLLKRLSVVGKAKSKDAKCETEVQGDVPSVVLVSGTGEGKSTTICALSGDPALAHVAEEGQMNSETSTSCIHKASWFYPYEHTKPLYLVDTPGFGDTRGDEFVKKSNDNIVETLRRAGHVHAILLVLHSKYSQLSQGRLAALRFMRSYFGQNIYEHLVVVYTHFSWRAKGPGPGGIRKGSMRLQDLKGHHEKMMQALLHDVEAEFWPDDQVNPGVKAAMLGLPCFGINTRVVMWGKDDDDDDEYDDEEDDVVFEDGTLFFADSDIDDYDYNRHDPDGRKGVLAPRTFAWVKPNSATQLRELREKIVEISQGPPVDLTHLRSFQDGCKATLADMPAKTDPVVFGQHVTDCVEGRQFKLLKDKVIPYLKDLENGLEFAAFCIRAYTAERGPKGSELMNRAMNALDVPEELRKDVEAFTSYGAYASCRDVAPGKDEVAESLSKCLGGMATPAVVTAMKKRFFGDEAKAFMSSKYVAKLVAEIGRLPEDKRAIVNAHMDFKKFMNQ